MRSDTGLVEQLRCELAGERLDLACELAFLGGQLQDAAGDRAEREQAAAQLRVAAACGPRRCEACSSRARVSGRSSLRSGSGVVISRSRSWQSPARLALTAPSRAATSACSAWRSPPARGVAGRSLASTLRAARTASSASVLPPERRSRRSRPTSSTRSPRPVRKRVRPAPNEPVPSTANAADRARARRRAQRLRVAVAVCDDRRLEHDRAADDLHDRERVRVAVRVDTNDVVQLICKHPYRPPAQALGDTTGVGLGMETAGGRTVTGHALTTRTGF